MHQNRYPGTDRPDFHNGLMNIIYGDDMAMIDVIFNTSSECDQKDQTTWYQAAWYARQVVTVASITMIIIFMMLILSN